MIWAMRADVGRDRSPARWTCALAATLTLIGCGSSPFVRTSAIHERPRRTHALPSALELPSGRPFARSPITDFAEAMADLALAAIEARPLPPSPMPANGALSARVDWRNGVTSLRQLSVLAVAIEVDLVLKRGEPPQGDVGPSRWGELRAVIALSRNGLRLVELRPGEMRTDENDRQPPPGLEGVRALARDLLAGLRSGDLSSYDLTEEDRALLANDVVWARIEHDRPHHGRLRDIQTMLEGLPEDPIAYRLDDVSVLARDERNHLYALSFELDPHGDTFALTTDPLVTVRRLWPLD